MLELKPCPFCGGEALLYDYEYGDDAATAYRCECDRCGAAMSGYDNDEEAVEAWNTRPERSCTVKITLDEETYEALARRLIKEIQDENQSNCGARVKEEPDAD